MVAEVNPIAPTTSGSSYHPKVSSGSQDLVFKKPYNKKISKPMGGHNNSSEIIRIVEITLPIFGEFEPFSYPLYVIKGGYDLCFCVRDLCKASDVKTISKELLVTAMAVAYLVWTIFENDLGDKISTGVDLIYNLYGMVVAISSREYTEFFEKILNIVDDSVWLISYYFCYVEIEALSYVIDGLSHCYSAYKEYKSPEGKKLEFLGDLCMSVIRAHNVVSYVPSIREKHSSQDTSPQLPLPTSPQLLLS
jgi:hypothetical protein